MAGIADQLGVQSYCFRGFKDNRKVAELVREIGLSRIELCGVHVNFADVASHQDVIDIYQQAGVQIISIGVQPLGQEAAMRPYLDFARRAGVKVITANFGPAATQDDFQTWTRLARAYDVRFAIHNHGGRHWLGNAAILSHLFAEADKRGDDRLGLCLDTAWALDAGEDPIAMAEKFASRLFGIHIKDFIFDRARKPEDVVVGTGNLDLPALISAVAAGGFSGACVLEYEGDVNNPAPALARCVEAVAAAA